MTPAGRGFAPPGRVAAIAASRCKRILVMNFPLRLTALAMVALGALSAPAHARNVRLLQSVPDAIRLTRTHDILGPLDLRFGSDTARGAALVRRDVLVKGVGSTRMGDVGQADSVRPADQDLCARAFEDAMTQLAFAARGANGTAIVGVVSAYEGKVYDDPARFECHVGALKAAVTLRAQIASGPVAPLPADVPVVSPPAPAVQPPVISPPPAPDTAPPPPAPTFQPLPPRPAPASN